MTLIYFYTLKLEFSWKFFKVLSNCSLSLSLSSNCTWTLSKFLIITVFSNGCISFPLNMTCPSFNMIAVKYSVDPPEITLYPVQFCWRIGKVTGVTSWSNTACGFSLEFSTSIWHWRKNTKNTISQRGNLMKNSFLELIYVFKN